MQNTNSRTFTQSTMTVSELLHSTDILHPSDGNISGMCLEDFTLILERMLRGECTTFVIEDDGFIKDGKKRFNIINSYIRGDYALTDSSLFSTLSQKAFSELPGETQEQILNLPLVVIHEG